MEAILSNGHLRVGVSPRGGVVSFAETHDGRAFLRGRLVGDDDPTGSACFPMLPLCNRVGTNSFVFAGRMHEVSANTEDPYYLHGDGWLSLWSVTEKSSLDVTLEMEHRGTPYAYHAVQRFRLAGNRLVMTLSVTNLGEAMPFGLGFHPYFPKAGASMQFGAAAYWNAAKDHLPTDRIAPVAKALDFAKERPVKGLTLDNAYDGWDGALAVNWPEKGLAVSLQADPVFDCLMLYAPSEDGSFFCAEPMSHLPNAVNMDGQPGLHVLENGQTLTGSITLTTLISEPSP